MKKHRPEAVKVNAHLHTPYSFSAFDDIPQALDMAVQEGVKVVGINDFYTMEGYGEWARECRRRRLCPLFNIEFIGLQEEDRAAGIRVNDPNNPGRTYLSGKGLAFPVDLTEPSKSRLAAVRKESDNHVRRMCGRLNEVLAERGTGLVLDFDAVCRELTKGSVRERHLAKALRLAAAKATGGDAEAFRALLEKVFGGVALEADPTDAAAVENEIRGKLLKAGGAAFVPESPEAFLPLEDVTRLILRAGGIPTYPFLADDVNGEFTDFERDLERAAETLKKRHLWSVEFITGRNSLETLERYAGYLHDAGFVVTFGSEHNTPAAEPITLTARGGVPLSPRLMQIGYEGACVVAAHQDIVESGMQGYVDERGLADVEKRDEYIEYGDQVIKAAIS